MNCRRRIIKGKHKEIWKGMRSGNAGREKMKWRLEGWKKKKRNLEKIK